MAKNQGESSSRSPGNERIPFDFITKWVGKVADRVFLTVCGPLTQTLTKNLYFSPLYILQYAEMCAIISMLALLMYEC